MIIGQMYIYSNKKTPFNKNVQEGQKRTMVIMSFA